MRILVLSLNPAVDVEWRVRDVLWEEKNNILEERRWPGGKGINVARWLKLFGAADSSLLLPLGGANGKELADGIRRLGLAARIVSIRQSSRANIVVTTASARQIRFNPLGPVLTKAEWAQIRRAVREFLAMGDCLVLSGSLPHEAAVETYADFIRLGQAVGARVVLDCDGEAFAAGVRQAPFLVKPNEFELAQWHGRPLTSERALEKAARGLSEATKGWVLVSRGAKGATLLNESEGCFYSASVPAITVKNTVGAGDALLAAMTWQIASASPPREWLRWGVAAGSAATEGIAGKLPSVRRVQTLARQTALS